jgi:hypothetical protein
MMVVEIEKPAKMTLAVWFNELRSWFDENSCQPTSFLPSERVIDKVVFDATFAQNTQALLFASKFARYAPAILRATSSELSEILPDEGSLAKIEAS